MYIPEINNIYIYINLNHKMYWDFYIKISSNIIDQKYPKKTKKVYIYYMIYNYYNIYHKITEISKGQWSGLNCFIYINIYMCVVRYKYVQLSLMDLSIDLDIYG